MQNSSAILGNSTQKGLRRAWAPAGQATRTGFTVETFINISVVQLDHGRINEGADLRQVGIEVISGIRKGVV